MYSLIVKLSDEFDCSKFKENIFNDFEIIKSIYLDNFEEIPLDEDEDYNSQTNKISFKLNMKLEMEADTALVELIEILKFSDLLINSSMIGLPFWIKFSCDIINNFLEIKFYLFWVKKNSIFYDDLNKIILKNINQDSLFFTIIEDLKGMIQPPDKKILINWLQQMKEELVIRKGEISINNIIYNNDKQMNPNNFLHSYFDEIETDNISLLKARSNRILENSKHKQEKIQNEIINNTQSKSFEYNEDQYEQFINDGGIVGDVTTDRGSSFQAHAIRISCMNDLNKYLKMLKTNNKIFKATHNILAYRVSDNDKGKEDKNKIVSKNKKKSGNGEANNVLQGFDDDGEDGAGIRLMGILEKMKILNVFVVVSRWFGGTMLGNDRFKHINDAAKNLISKNKVNFEFMK